MHQNLPKLTMNQFKLWFRTYFL